MPSFCCKQQTVLFDCSKNELCTPTSGLKTLLRKFRGQWKTSSIKDEVTFGRLQASR